jgi:hypothetical protein
MDNKRDNLIKKRTIFSFKVYPAVEKPTFCCHSCPVSPKGIPMGKYGINSSGIHNLLIFDRFSPRDDHVTHQVRNDKKCVFPSFSTVSLGRFSILNLFEYDLFIYLK